MRSNWGCGELGEPVESARNAAWPACGKFMVLKELGVFQSFSPWPGGKAARGGKPSRAGETFGAILRRFSWLKERSIPVERVCSTWKADLADDRWPIVPRGTSDPANNVQEEGRGSGANIQPRRPAVGPYNASQTRAKLEHEPESWPEPWPDWNNNPSFEAARRRYPCLSAHRPPFRATKCAAAWKVQLKGSRRIKKDQEGSRRIKKNQGCVGWHDHTPVDVPRGTSNRKHEPET